MPIEPPSGSRSLPGTPAVEGWFTLGDEPRLIGKRCASCSTIVFPPRALACPNPHCAGTELQDTELGRAGRVWSWATNHYPPPAPYVAADPFLPFTVVAAELEAEKIVILGALAAGADPGQLRLGQRVELSIGTLFETDDDTKVVWQWTPLAEPAR